jgi:hypothetical protein
MAGIDLHIATGSRKHGETIAVESGSPESATPKQVMQHKLRTEAGYAVYKMRKAIVELVLARSRNNEACAASACAAWARYGPKGSSANLLKFFRSG